LAILQLWYPGEEGGRALANLLTGRRSPSGRLPLTVYRSADDLPAFTDYAMARRTYRYFDGPVEFPFGFGLSYATFNYSTPELSTRTLAAGQPLHVRTNVTNTSQVEADEVVELYVVPPQKTVGVPRLALQGIQRVHLKAGESRVVQFNLTQRQLSFVDANGVRAIRAGSYRIVAAGAQPKDLPHAGVSFEITGEMQLEP
jgi:beta-glucosidase